MKRLSFVTPLLLAAMVFLASCGGKEKSSSTGWNYNDEKNGGFEKVEYTEQETGPGLVLIEGGTFSMGRTEQDITMDWANIQEGPLFHLFIWMRPKFQTYITANTFIG